MNKKNLLKIFVTVGLLSYLVYKINIFQIVEVFQSVNYYKFWVLIFVVPLMQFVRVLRWDLLLKKVGIICKKKKLFYLVLYGNILGMVTPGRVGELFKISKLRSGKSKTLPTVFWEKIIDFANLAFLGLIVIPFVLPGTISYLLMFVFLVILLVFILLITNSKAIGLVTRVFNISLENKEEYLATMKRIMADKRLLLYTFLYATFYHSLNFYLYYVVLTAIDVSLPAVLALSLPLMAIFGNFPITISGFGLREGVAVLIFHNFGILPEIAFTFSILVYVLLYFYIIIIFGLFYLYKKIKRWRRSMKIYR